MTVFNKTITVTATSTTSIKKSVGQTTSATATSTTAITTDTRLAGWNYVVVNAGSFIASSVASVLRYVTVTQSGSQIALHNNTPTKAYKAGGIASDKLKVSTTFNTKQILRQALTQALGTSGTPRNAIPVSVTAQHLGVHNNAPTVKLGVLLKQFLGLHDSRVAVAKLQQALVDHLGATGLPLSKFAKLVHENLGLALTLSPLLRAIASKSGGGVGVHNNAPTVQKFAIAALTSRAQFNQTLTAKQLLKALVQETIDLEIALVDPSGDVTTWVINTRTGALTEYGNYAFNSFAQNGLHYMGASDAGLFALDGSDDSGVPVLAHLRSGYSQFGGSHFNSLKAVYLGVRGTNDMLFKIDTGDGRSTTYKARIQDTQTTKVLVGKGIRARYIAFELLSEGQDFDLDSVEFVPAVAQRRV